MKRLDYKIDSDEERLTIVNSILESECVKGYLMECQSDKNSRLLETLANYLCRRSCNLKSFVGSKQSEKLEDICKRENDIIKQYSDYRDYLKRVKKMPEYDNKKMYVDRILGSVNDDIRIVNECMFPKVQAKEDKFYYKSSSAIAVDYTNVNHVKCILLFPKLTAEDPCYFAKEDIMNIVRKYERKFTRRELDVIRAFYQDGGFYTVTDVAEILGMKKSNVSRCIDRAVKKIAEIELSIEKNNEKRI